MFSIKDLTSKQKFYSFFPINQKYKKYQDFASQLRQMLWFENEFNPKNDLKDFNTMQEEEKNVLKKIIAFFVTSDNIIMNNIEENFSKEFQPKEIVDYYKEQDYNENIHWKMYSLFQIIFAESEKEQKELERAVENDPTIKKKADWTNKWFNREIPLQERIIAFSIVEGLFFCSAFCVIFWFREKGILKEFCDSNNFIFRDESLHFKVAVNLYNDLYDSERIKPEKFYSMLKEAVLVEEEFVRSMIPIDLNGMNQDLMIDYVHHIANRISNEYKYESIYDTYNPFDFMDKISLMNQTSFFERVTTEYQRSGNIEDEDEDIGDALFY